MVKLFTGWGNRGKPFTREQFLKSHIKKSYGRSFSYLQYKKEIASPRSKKLKHALKIAMGGKN
jgi:hypothetical protein